VDLGIGTRTKFSLEKMMADGMPVQWWGGSDSREVTLIKFPLQRYKSFKAYLT
jgi:hypothetical protein